MPGMTSLSTEVCVGGDKKDKGPTLETTSIGLITKNSHGTSSSKFTKKAHITQVARMQYVATLISIYLNNAYEPLSNFYYSAMFFSMNLIYYV